MSKATPATPGCAYWTRIRTKDGWLVELASDGDPEAMLGLLPEGDRAEVSDAKRGIVRAAVIADGQLQGALFIARDGGLPPRDWLIEQLGGEGASTVELLAGRSAAPQADRGPIICVCFDVGMKTILDTIRNETLTSVDAVGAALNAGTNCGSCRPAIARLLETERSPAYA